MAYGRCCNTLCSLLRRCLGAVSMLIERCLLRANALRSTERVRQRRSTTTKTPQPVGPNAGLFVLLYGRAENPAEKRIDTTVWSGDRRPCPGARPQAAAIFYDGTYTLGRGATLRSCPVANIACWWEIATGDTSNALCMLVAKCCVTCRGCIGPHRGGSSAVRRRMKRAIGCWRGFRFRVTCIRGTWSRGGVWRWWWILGCRGRNSADADQTRLEPLTAVRFGTCHPRPPVRHRHSRCGEQLSGGSNQERKD